MSRTSRALVCALTALAVLVGLAATTSVSASATESASQSARKATKVTAVKLLGTLKVRTEKRAGYRRSKFTLWTSHGGGCDTRAVVLKTESKRRTTQNRYCTVKRGKWRSEYDGKVVRRASKLDIDHRVPLAEAWDSGARRWKASTRKAYANDLRYAPSLLAVTARSNRSKSDRDPAQWMPRRAKCAYAKRWVGVKYRWSLSVDKREKRALRKRIARCGDKQIAKPSKATVRRTSGGSSSGGGSTSGGLDPRFGTCSEAISRGYGPYVRGRDTEYAWYRDADSDGTVCER